MTAPVFDLPVADKPGWELKNDSEELKSIPDSCVILQSLRQSRERWLSSMFPKFSTKARTGKVPEPLAPPHTIQSRGRCDLQIGPHTFPSTTFYEVHYLGQANVVAPQPAPGSGDATLNPVTMITPALITQVNSAATSNPTLAHLLQLAAAGEAAPEQLKTLGVLIQSLAGGTPAATTSISVAQPKDFDLVIEFADNNSERWIFPRGPVVCDKNSDTCPLDVTITARVPFPETKSDQFPDTSTPQAVTFLLKRAPMTVWDTILRWAGGEEKMKESRKILDQLKPRKRTYLAYRLPDGALLSQLQTAAKPSASLMKPVKPPSTPPAKPKRKPVPKKPPGEGGTSRKASTSSISNPKQTHSSSTSASPPKRQRVTSTKSTAPANQIRCMTCGKTDVPLILGGRYCRPCVESGKSNLVASGTVPSTYRYYFATDMSKLSISTTPPSISNTPPQPSSSQTATN